MLEKMKEITFEKANDVAWRKSAEQSLRGIPLDKLRAETMEGISISPIYTKEGYDAHFKGEDATFIAAIRAGNLSQGWTIAQATHERTGANFVREVKESLDLGNGAIVYDGKKPADWKKEDLQALANLVTTYPLYAFDVDAADDFCTLFDLVKEDKREQVTGVVTGISLPKEYEQMRTSCADLVDFQLQGADAVMELALSLAIAVKEVEKYPTFEEFLKRFSVQFALDTSFFMEIAKIRAIRVLMATLARAYEAVPAHIPILAETSLRTYTRFDAHTNLLRAGNEAFAAVLGGADVLTVHPHNILEAVTPRSIRTARNIQLIIREETFAKHVLDPAGGSYYIDMLTDRLIQAAWRLFQTIEEVGGYDAYVASGALEERLKKANTERSTRLNTGKNTLVGTNKYVDLQESISEKAAAVVNGRLAESFEALRIKGDTHSPRTVIIRYGTLAEYKPPTDFVKGFLAVGGIQAEESPVFSDVQQTIEWLHESNYDYYVICTDPRHVSAVEQIAMVAIDKWIDVAGRFDEDVKARLKTIGISGFMYQGQAQLEKLSAIYARMKKGDQHDEA
jgi:methylmalonyl-CoA mutase